MSDPPSEHPEQETQERRSVLAELPRARPQRASARRESARKQARATKAPPAKAPPAKAASVSSRAAPKRRSRSKVAKPPPTPPQGYEADQDLAGTSLAPPSGAEMLTALAELAAELAQNGISTGGRLLKSALSRLPGP